MSNRDSRAPKGIVCGPESVGRAVVYRDAPCYVPQEGVITSFNDKYVFVRYGAKKHSEATNPLDLDFVGVP